MEFQSTLIASLAALMLALPVLSQASAQPAAASQPITIGERYQIHSDAIGETRSYFVHRPANYDLSGARYPVLIVLDGDGNFQHASTTVDFLTGEKIPPMLVVGIPNTDRNRDLIPPARSAGTSAPSAQQNGAANFLKFITTELIPKIDHDFRTQRYRILVGHSNGGLFGLYSLITAPGVFKAYILASPALGLQDRELLDSVGAFVTQRGEAAASVYLSLANETDLLSSNWELASYLQRAASRDSRWSFTFRRYPEENHGSVGLRSLYDGLGFVFDGWRIPDSFAAYEQGGIAAIEKYYATLSSRFGFTVRVPSGILLAPAYPLYRQKRVDEAEKVILRTLAEYPNDTGALLTAGRLYFDRGDKAKATEYLTKALFLSPRSRSIGVDYAALNLDPAKVVPSVQLSASDLQKYVGAYGSSVPAPLQIVRRGGKLFAVTADRDDELTPLSATGFYYTNQDDVITFRRDDRGRVVGLEMQSRGVELARRK